MNSKKSFKEDPRLTAYILGELEAEERAQFENEIQNDPELKSMVDELRKTSDALQREFAETERPEMHLKKSQKRKLFGDSNFNLLSLPALSSVAAGILILMILPLGLYLKDQFENQAVPTEVAVVDPAIREEVPQQAQPTPRSKAKASTPKKESRGRMATQSLIESEADMAMGFSQKSIQPNALTRMPEGAGYPIPGEVGSNRENYDSISENAFKLSKDHPLSTFSVDVDTASYANLRRFITQMNQIPPSGAIRIEEMINYFNYDYPQPKNEQPFSVNVEVARSPWSENRIVRIGLQGKAIDLEDRPSSNLVFLLDVSGSMNQANKLPLLKKAFKMLVEQLGENDKVSIVVYAGASGVVLDGQSGDNNSEILSALNRLRAGGSTNGGAGIQAAYDLAQKHFIRGGINRVLLATDGDFNVGTSSRSGLTDLIKEKAKSGVFLSVLGFGSGNFNDAMLEEISGKGNGNYSYIDSEKEARKVLINQLSGTLMTIAKDVKIQVEFNPEIVGSYRLIGYENRMLAKEDFNNDKKDAGEIGAGHQVTALYEVTPVTGNEQSQVDPLKYSSETEASGDFQNEMMTVKLRYKKPDGSKSILIEQAVRNQDNRLKDASDDFRFAVGVAGFGQVLRDSEHIKDFDLSDVRDIVIQARGEDKEGYRDELIDLVIKAKGLNK